MNVKMFAIFDSATEAFMQPFFSQSQGAAIRSLQDAVNDPQHPFAKHAMDYTLFVIGEFDDTSGVVLPANPAPVRIMGVAELVFKEVSASVSRAQPSNGS